MRQTIWLLVAPNLYDSKRYFAKYLQEAMLRKGIDAVIVTDGAPFQSGMKPDMLFSFNTVLPLPDGRHIYDVWKIPFVAAVVDPIYPYMYLTQSDYTLIGSVDRTDCEFLASQGYSRAFFWPHAVERELDVDPTADKPYDVVLVGSCYDPDTLRAHWQQMQPKELCQIADDAIELTLSQKSINFYQATLTALEAHGRTRAEVPFEKLFSYVDNYVRGMDRLNLVRSIKNAQVHVFGDKCWRDEQPVNGWEHYLADQPNVTLHPGVSYADSMSILKKSKICLNSVPFSNRSHERMFTSFACRSLLITTENEYLHDALPFDIPTYQPKKWEGVNDTVNYYLTNENERQELVNTARAHVMQHHTWDQRVDQFQQETQRIFADRVCN